MYSKEEGIREQIKAERKSICLFFAFVLLLIFIIVFTGDNLKNQKIYYAIYIGMIFLIIKFTKIYFFFLPRRRYGSVVAMSNFKEEYSMAKMGADSHECGVLAKTLFTLELLLDDGKNVSCEFEFKGAIKKLKIGDRVGIYRFLKMPVYV